MLYDNATNNLDANAPILDVPLFTSASIPTAAKPTRPINGIEEVTSGENIRRPLRVMFMQTDMRIGGAEMLTANIIRRLNRDRISPELCCLKERGELGEALASEISVHDHILTNKYDLRVWPRLTHLLRQREIDAVITVGAGDKMFWGRLAARRVGVPVILSALHSTGWPDGVGRLNRILTPLTDAFIAVADSHGQFLAQNLRVPRERVAVIPNGVDTERFAPVPDVAAIRKALNIGPTDPVLGIVAALRPEKNHELFLGVAARIVKELPNARFLIVGDGPCRASLEQHAESLGIADRTIFAGSRPDVPRLLAAMDVFALTSHMEANPLSILEAMSVGRPVVSTNVGSIHEAVIEAQTGFLVPAGDAATFANRVLSLLNAPILGHVMGAAARKLVVERWSIDAMVTGYERLIESTYARKTQAAYN
ncbi:MAG TPA: glycosyltransferase [Lacipirellulaceae bacterium]|jgi:glycosyltransferase involved in cell wall biosynthesis|nr:glycosyltransferase [Lacipirellulaceae bacterium]